MFAGLPLWPLIRHAIPPIHVSAVLLRPGMYIGAIDRVEGLEWVYNPRRNVMQRKAVKVSPALLTLFDEILVCVDPTPFFFFSLLQSYLRLHSSMIFQASTGRCSSMSYSGQSGRVTSTTLARTRMRAHADTSTHKCHGSEQLRR